LDSPEKRPEDQNHRKKWEFKINTITPQPRRQARFEERSSRAPATFSRPAHFPPINKKETIIETKKIEKKVIRKNPMLMKKRKKCWGREIREEIGNLAPFETLAQGSNTGTSGG